MAKFNKTITTPFNNKMTWMKVLLLLIGIGSHVKGFQTISYNAQHNNNNHATFSPRIRSITATQILAPTFVSSSSSSSLSPSISTATALYGSKADTDGTQRGIVIFVLAILLNIWSFSIPVEFRRAHFCFTNKCAANPTKCDDCVTFVEWRQGVADYYKNGGGIQFDFSIEQQD